MEFKPLILAGEERLQALRRLDIFHPWESVDEKRLCRRCRQIITGWGIQICADPSGEPARLECPTEGCLGVPLEWIMLDSPVEAAPSNPPDTSQAATSRINKPAGLMLAEEFGFLKVPPVRH